MPKYSKKRYRKHSPDDQPIKEHICKTDVLDNEKKNWTNELTDLLLEAYLVEWLSPYSANEERAFICSNGKVAKTFHAVETKVRKLGYCYPDSKHYNPRKRSDRTGQPFTERDLYIIQRAFSLRGRICGGYRPEWLALVLGRHVHEVRRWIDDKARKAPKGFGHGSDNKDMQNADIIYRAYFAKRPRS